MPPEIFQYIVILLPLLIIIILALFFYRMFTKSSQKDRDYLNKIKELEAVRKIAEFKSARIISAQPQMTSHYSPGLKTVNLRFEIEDTPGNYKMLSAVWQMDDYLVSNFQSGAEIQVKVYNENVFSSDDRVNLLP
jgi:preprotein translocase subunit YajC